jgi:hypothetical protein
LSGFSSTMGFVGLAVARWKEAVLNDLEARASGSTGLGTRRLFGRGSARISFLDGLSPLVGSMTMYKDFVGWQGSNAHLHIPWFSACRTWSRKSWHVPQDKLDNFQCAFHWIHLVLGRYQTRQKDVALNPNGILRLHYHSKPPSHKPRRMLDSQLHILCFIPVVHHPIRTR